MRYKPKSVAALQIALGGLPSRVPVEVDPGIAIKAKSVGELRKSETWPENLAVSILPRGRSDMAVKISKATTAIRTSHKS
jgi:hypothetical protein